MSTFGDLFASIRKATTDKGASSHPHAHSLVSPIPIHLFSFESRYSPSSTPLLAKGGGGRSHKTYNEYDFRGVAADWGGGDGLSGCRLPSSTHRGWICGQILQEVMLRFISGLRYLRVNSERVLRCENSISIFTC